MAFEYKSLYGLDLSDGEATARLAEALLPRPGSAPMIPTSMGGIISSGHPGRLIASSPSSRTPMLVSPPMAVSGGGGWPTSSADEGSDGRALCPSIPTGSRASASAALSPAAVPPSSSATMDRMANTVGSCGLSTSAATSSLGASTAANASSTTAPKTPSGSSAGDGIGRAGGASGGTGSAGGVGGSGGDGGGGEWQAQLREDAQHAAALVEAAARHRSNVVQTLGTSQNGVPAPESLGCVRRKGAVCSPPSPLVLPLFARKSQLVYLFRLVHEACCKSLQICALPRRYGGKLDDC